MKMEEKILNSLEAETKKQIFAKFSLYFINEEFKNKIMKSAYQFLAVW